MSIKLTYFNLKGRAEFARLVLVQAGQEWEDVRIDQVGGSHHQRPVLILTLQAKWAELKPTLPLGQVPCLEMDGVTICLLPGSLALQLLPR